MIGVLYQCNYTGVNISVNITEINDRVSIAGDNFSSVFKLLELMSMKYH